MKKPWIDKAIADGYPGPEAVKEAKKERAKQLAYARAVENRTLPVTNVSIDPGPKDLPASKPASETGPAQASNRELLPEPTTEALPCESDAFSTSPSVAVPSGLAPFPGNTDVNMDGVP